jgi:hypothetical protein
LFCFALLQRWCSAAALAGALCSAAALAGAVPHNEKGRETKRGDGKRKIRIRLMSAEPLRCY